MITINNKEPETIYIDNKEVSQIEINNDVVWVKQQQIPDYFYIENISNESGEFSINISLISSNTEYSTDGTTWTSYDFTNGENISLNPNSKLYLRGTSWTINYTTSNTHFNFTKDYIVGGNIMSLINYNTMETVNVLQKENKGLGYLFCKQTHLISVEKLNFGNVSSFSSLSLRGFLSDCSNLTTSPNLSNIKTITANSLTTCFLNCTNLTNGPDLSNVISASNSSLTSCFYGCSSLISVTAPNISSWNTQISTNWLYGVAATGIVHKPTNLSIPTDSVSGIPTGWTTQNY